MKYKYRIIGYQIEIGTSLQNAVSIWVTSENSGEAFDKAKKMLKKKHYRVAEVHEIDKNSPLQEYNTQNLLFQRYRKKIDTEILKNNHKSLQLIEEQNKYLAKIVKVLERR
jgi:hypothetical protein